MESNNAGLTGAAEKADRAQCPKCMHYAENCTHVYPSPLERLL